MALWPCLVVVVIVPDSVVVLGFAADAIGVAAIAAAAAPITKTIEI